MAKVKQPPMDWRARLVEHWPGVALWLFFAAGFYLFGRWDWALLAPLFYVAYRVLRGEYWPIYLTALLYTLSFPHAGLGFLGFICLAPLLIVTLDAPDGRRAMWLAWLGGTLSNIGKLYWLVYPITYFSPIPLSVAVAIMLLLTSTLGLFWSLHFRLTRYLVRERGLALWLVFPVGWLFWDYFLNWFLTGFPWDLLGDAAYSIPYFNQTFDLIGAMSVGGILAFGNVVAVEIWHFARKRRAFPVAQTAVLAGLVIAGFVYGVVRTGQIERAMATAPTVTVGLVQGNVDQSIKWQSGFRERILDEYMKLAKQVSAQGAELIVFPETAIPRRQDRWMPLHPEISRYARRTGTYVLAGVPTTVRRLNRGDPRGDFARHNSAVLISPRGDDLMWYDKNRLVPFGEYIPKKHWLQKIAGRQLRGTLNFEESGRYTKMPFPGAPFSVFICYESVYASTVRTLTNLGARFLVTITNDAWFGPTSAPHQHWAQVAIRAIENRRCVARAANTGISGTIDALGRTQVATPIYEEAALTAPVCVLDIKSVYGRIGDAVTYAANAVYLVLLGWAGIGWVRRRKETRDA